MSAETATIETPIAAPASPAPVAPPPAAPTTIVAPPAAPAAEPRGVVLTPEMFEQHMARLNRLDQIEREAEAKVKAAEQRAYDAAVKEGDAKKLAEILDARVKADEERQGRERQDLQARYEADRKRIEAEKAAADNARNAIHQRAQRYALDGELSRVLAGHNLVQGGAEQLAHLWRSQFTVAEEGESFAVRAATGQSVAEFVQAQLAQPNFAHFVRAATGHGGTITPGQNNAGSAPAPPQPEPPPQFKNFGDALVYDGKLRAQQAQQRGGAATDMSQPIGLGRNAGLRVAQ